MSFIGAGVRDAYLTLLELAVVLQLIPFVYLYLGLIRVAGQPGGHYKNPLVPRIAGLAGLAGDAPRARDGFRSASDGGILPPVRDQDDRGDGALRRFCGTPSAVAPRRYAVLSAPRRQ